METHLDRLEAVELECVRADRRLFSGVSFSLRASELLHVVGANGSGKTTLLRMLCGLVRPVRGEVRWNDNPISRVGDDYLKCLTHLGHSNAVKDDLTCRENLLVSTTLSGTRATAGRLNGAIEQAGLSKYAGVQVRVLSQGQRRRLALARLLLSDTVLWILDEPFNALDTAAVEGVQLALKVHLAEGGMAILTSHQKFHVDTRVKHLEIGDG